MKQGIEGDYYEDGCNCVNCRLARMEAALGSINAMLERLSRGRSPAASAVRAPRAKAEA